MLQFPALSEDCNISHFVTTRQGGVSKGAYASFNPGEYSGDNPEAVRANRKLLSDAIRIPSERIIGLVIFSLVRRSRAKKLHSAAALK